MSQKALPANKLILFKDYMHVRNLGQCNDSAKLKYWLRLSQFILIKNIDPGFKNILWNKVTDFVKSNWKLEWTPSKTDFESWAQKIALARWTEINFIGCTTREGPVLVHSEGVVFSRMQSNLESWMWSGSGFSNTWSLPNMKTRSANQAPTCEVQATAIFRSGQKKEGARLTRETWPKETIQVRSNQICIYCSVQIQQFTPHYYCFDIFQLYVIL